MLRIILILLALISSKSSFAATQGSVGTNSSGDIDINLTLGLLARISGISDIAFGSWTSGNLNANQNLCVGLFGTNLYQFRATGSGNNSSANAFALSNGSDYIPYRVFFNDSTGLGGRTELSAATSINNQSASFAFFNIFGCLVRNANLSIIIEEPALESAETGSYTGTLTLTIIPE